jgi:hypothetical protein
VRRPLRRRFDTMKRPARVRIRKRKPCTRARRRLFGWKVRLPLATAFSSLCPALPSGRSRFATWVDPRVGRGWSCCWPARSPGTLSLVAAVSPAFGRLFEGTDEPSPGQTWPAPTDPLNSPPNMRSRRGSPYEPSDNPNEPQKNPIGMQQNGWQPHGKLLISGNAVSGAEMAVDNEARMADRLAV